MLISQDFNPGAVLDRATFANPLETPRSTSPCWGGSGKMANVMASDYALLVGPATSFSIYNTFSATEEKYAQSSEVLYNFTADSV